MVSGTGLVTSVAHTICTVWLAKEFVKVLRSRFVINLRNYKLPDSHLFKNLIMHLKAYY
jgi:hypothetical protein